MTIFANLLRGIKSMTTSNEFVLHDYLDSQIGARNGYEEQFQPPDHIIENLKELHENLIKPLMDFMYGGKFVISSGYRCPRVNKKAGGAGRSQHMTGMAVDLKYVRDNQMDNGEIINTLIMLDLPFDQCIDEFNLSWVHLSFDPSRNRRQLLKIG